MSTIEPQPLKVLMLHGFTQSGPLFHAKTRALEKAILKSFPASTFHYPTSPIPLRPADIPGFALSSQYSTEDVEAFGWWRRKDGTTVYEGIEKGLATVAETIRNEGPFDGVMGFSQGGALAAMVAALLEEGRRKGFEEVVKTDEKKLPYPSSFIAKSDEPLQPPLKFAIIYSGFAAPFDLYEGFYNPKITTPMLHFLGSLDTVVEEKRGRALIESCANEQVVVHPGGHFVPSQKVWLEAAVAFVRRAMDGGEVGAGKEKKAEERVEDMDMPF